MEELNELRGCVRKSDPSEFWHASGSLEHWVGKQVRFVLKQNGREQASVPRIIESISEKPAYKVSATNLEGTLAAIAMCKMDMTFLQFFHNILGGHDLAMVIRVRKP